MIGPVRFSPAVILLCLCFSLSRAEIKPEGGRELISPQIIRSMQSYMFDQRLDGWIFSGQGAFDDIQSEFLGLKGTTRHRWIIFFFTLDTIKKPFLIYNPDDEQAFSGINFYPLPYNGYREMEEAIKYNIKPSAFVIFANYSNRMEIPEISTLDAGVLELLSSLGFKIQSSGTLLSFYNTRWTMEEAASHKQAAAALDSLLPLAVGKLKERLAANKKITDYELRQYVEKSLKKLGLEILESPTVAAGEKTRLERYCPSRNESRTLERGDLLYLEVQARLKGQPEAMFAKLGWTLYLGESVPDSLGEEWERLDMGNAAALELLESRIPGGKTLLGCEVDQTARAKISGGDHKLLPRPYGFNINRLNKRFGVNFDDHEAHDTRKVEPGLGFTLEPGFYRSAYALRSCANLFIDGTKEISLSAPLQKKIIPVLGPPEMTVEQETK